MIGEINYNLCYSLISFSLKLYIALIVCGSIGHLSFNRKNWEHSSENTVHAVILITLTFCILFGERKKSSK